MKITKINNFDAYCDYRDSNTKNYQKIYAYEKKINNKLSLDEIIYLDGFSWPAQSKSKFLIDGLYANNNEVNFRERMVCQQTELNNRIRGSIHVFEDYFKAKKTDSIYLTEQCTMLGKWMQKKYSNIECSEYLSNCSEINQEHLQHYINPYKLKHQDLTNLTYKTNLFDYVLSFDCFEHIPNYKKAFLECLKVLKPGGKLMWSVPFDRNLKSTLVRASIDKHGEIKHHVEPEYHGDPTSEDGCLSFYTFGWDLLDELLEIGFKNTYALLFYSKKYGYIGGEQLLLCAEK